VRYLSGAFLCLVAVIPSHLAHATDAARAAGAMRVGVVFISSCEVAWPEAPLSDSAWTEEVEVSCTRQVPFRIDRESTREDGLEPGMRRIVLTY